MADKAASTCSVSYVGQAHPFDVMDVLTWSKRATEEGATEGSASAAGSSSEGGAVDFRVDFMIGEEVITRVSLGVPVVGSRSPSRL